jgi:hypothetical protein
MDQQDTKELLEAMLTKKDKNANKYPGPGGSVVRWKLETDSDQEAREQETAQALTGEQIVGRADWPRGPYTAPTLVETC